MTFAVGSPLSIDLTEGFTLRFETDPEDYSLCWLTVFGENHTMRFIFRRNGTLLRTEASTIDDVGVTTTTVAKPVGGPDGRVFELKDEKPFSVRPQQPASNVDHPKGDDKLKPVSGGAPPKG